MSMDAKPPPPEFSQFSGLRNWKQRLTLSLIVGIAMTAVPLISGWISVRDISGGAGGTRQLWYELLQHRRVLASFREELKRLPESMDELRTENPKSDSVSPDDPWGHPYWFERAGDEGQIGSYGRDGKPGGRGLDADRTTDEPFPPAARLTLWQYLFEIDSGGVWLTSACSGLWIAALVWRESRPDQWSVWNGLGLLVVLGVWAALSSFAAMVIAALELIPNGH